MKERNVRRYARRYARVIADATPYDIAQACSWYSDAERECEALAHKHEIPVAVACGVVAAWSPRMPWKRNLRVADLWLQGETGLGMGSSVVRARDVMKWGISALDKPSSPKTYNFALNLFGDTDAVTIDVHMLRAAGDDGRDAPTRVQYREMVAAVRRVARRWKMQPRDMQALIWIMQRGRTE